MILAIADLSRIIIIAEVVRGAYLLFLFPGSDASGWGWCGNNLVPNFLTES